MCGLRFPKALDKTTNDSSDGTRAGNHAALSFFLNYRSAEFCTADENSAKKKTRIHVKLSQCAKCVLSLVKAETAQHSLAK